MRRIKIILLVLILLNTGCSSLKKLTPEMETSYFETFARGEIRLDCNLCCAGLWGRNRSAEKSLYDSAKWKELALLVTKVGHNSDQAYFYLGRSAEGLGKPDIALIYYKLSAESKTPCNGIINNCDGLSFPQDIRVRVSSIFAAKKNQDTTPVIPAGTETVVSDKEPTSEKTDEYNEVAIAKSGGVYTIPVLINEVLTMSFIIDSGAADVSMSPDVVLTLIKTNTVSKNDWLPGQKYKLADGSVAESNRFLIRTLKIGTRTLKNIPCSISSSIDAPLLLGQSALEELGNFSFDYDAGLVRFKEKSENEARCKTDLDCGKGLKCRSKKNGGTECR